MSFWESAFSWISGNSFGASLAKTAALGYVSKLLSDNVNENRSGENVVDPGVRLQLNPSTENRIPVLYGEAFFSGNITDAQLSTNYKKMTYCLTLAEVVNTKLSTNGAASYTMPNVYINNNRVVFKADGFTVDYTLDASGNQDITYRDLIKIYAYVNGQGMQPVGYSGTTPASHTVMPGWTAGTHPMTALIYSIVEITYSRANNVTSLPEITYHIANDMTKPGDVIADYMISTTYGAGIPIADIDLASLVALNTWADTGYTYTNLSGQTVTAPIDLNGLVDTGTEVLTNMEELAKCASSWLSFDIHKGQWTVVINKAENSIASLTDSNIIGEISISGTSLTQLNNAANVKYQNADILDKADFVKITLPSGALYDNEPSKTLETTLAFTNRQTTAYKIGSQLLKQGRVDKIISFTTDYSYVNLTAGDVIDITSPVYNFVNKKFRIITAQESQGDAGDIQIQFTALEYDADVYVYDIDEFAVETDDGILTIGAIGKPNTPTVTKTEQANVPKIVINAVVPSGIVDAMEFWITFDTSVTPDSARTYIQIGAVQNPDGTQLTENQAVSYTYSGLGQGNFFVKVRGVNSVASGPYSDPSGLIQYVPVVVADTLSDTPVSINGQLMSLGLLTLLNNLDLLYKGISDPGSLFDKIFSIFEEKTGTDLVQQASTGLPAAFTVQDEGVTLGTQISSINFTGAGVTASGAGGAITVNVPGGSGGGGSVQSINDLSDVDTVTDTPDVGDYLKWNGTNWVPSSISGGGGGGTTPTDTTCEFTFVGSGLLFLPPDEGTTSVSYPENSNVTIAGNTTSSDRAPTTGSYFIFFQGADQGTPLVRGTTGNAKLYKSDGTLVQSLTFNDIIIKGYVVELPFSNRQKGTDYYITVDKGIVKNAFGCANPAILPATWNFNTPWEDYPAYVVGTFLTPTPEGCGSLIYQSFAVESYFTSLTTEQKKSKANRQTDIRINFNYGVVLNNAGTVNIYTAAGSLVQTIDGSKASKNEAGEPYGLLWTSGSSLYIDPTIDLTPGTTYYVTLTADVVKDACGNKNSAITNPNTIRFTTDGGPVLDAIVTGNSGSVNQDGLTMTFDRPVAGHTGAVKVYDSSNNLITTITHNDPGITITQGVA